MSLFISAKSDLSGLRMISLYSAFAQDRHGSKRVLHLFGENNCPLAHLSREYLSGFILRQSQDKVGCDWIGKVYPSRALRLSAYL